MTNYRRDPATGQLAQLMTTRADYDTGDHDTDSTAWVVVWCQPGSGLSVRILDADEAETWTMVEVVEPDATETTVRLTFRPNGGGSEFAAAIRNLIRAGKIRLDGAA